MPDLFDDLEVLKSAERLGDEIWRVVNSWPYFERGTVGKQLARSADSVGANIAESFGRYHYGEKLQFLYFARGSLFETKYWIKRAAARKIISTDKMENLVYVIANLLRQLNGFIAYIKRQRTRSNTKIRESNPTYTIE